MAELKTKPTAESVSDFLKRVEDKGRRDDCLTVIDIMKDVTKEDPQMWGSSIVGFGRYRYKYESGREGEWMITGFSPRKNDLTLYIMGGFESVSDLMKRLGKHKTGKSCLYIKKLADVDLKVLRQLVETSVKQMAGKRIVR
jgi:predicted CopG family antitoxin